jgi:hypothetical protein
VTPDSWGTFEGWAPPGPLFPPAPPAPGPVATGYPTGYPPTVAYQPPQVTPHPPAPGYWAPAPPQGASPYGPPPVYFPPARPPGQPGGGRRTAAIIGTVVTVLVAAGIGVGLALSGSSGSSHTAASSGTRTPRASSSARPASSSPALKTRVASLASTLRSPGGASLDPVFTLSSDGTLLAGQPYTAHPASIYIWNTATGKFLTTLALPGKEWLYPLAFSSDDKTFFAEVASGSAAYQLYAFSPSSGQASKVGEVPPSDVSYGFSVNGTAIAFEDPYGDTIDVSTLGGAKIGQPVLLPSATGIVDGSIGVDAAGTRVILTNKSGTVYVVDVAVGKVLDTFHCGYNTSTYYVFPELANNGQAVFCPGVSGHLNTLWDVDTGANITPNDPRWTLADTHLAFLSTDGSVIVTQPFGNPNALDLWSTATGDYLRTEVINAPADYVIAITPDGRDVLTTSIGSGYTGYQTLSLYTLP